MTARRARRAGSRRADRAGLAVLALAQAAAPVPASGPWTCSTRSASPTAPARAPALAYGRKRALELALALALDPQLLLLDEPTAGMGLEDVDRTVDLITRVASGRTVVMVEHNMSVVGPLADRVTVLQAGGVLVEGPYEQVRDDERVITAYLGTEDAEHLLSRPPASRSAVSAGYGDAQVLREVNLDVGPGEVVTLVGRNGAGKTTLLRSVMGLHPHSHRAGSLDGDDLSRLTPTPRARLGLGWVPDDRGIYATLSVEEHLLLPPVTRPESAWSLDQVYEAFPALRERADSPAPSSPAVSSRCSPWPGCSAWAPACCSRRPSEGLSPVLVERIGEIIREIKAHGVSVLLVEQNLTFATTVADRHYLLAAGPDRRVARQRRGPRAREELLDHLGM